MLLPEHSFWSRLTSNSWSHMIPASAPWISGTIIVCPYIWTNTFIFPPSLLFPSFFRCWVLRQDIIVAYELCNRDCPWILDFPASASRVLELETWAVLPRQSMHFPQGYPILLQFYVVGTDPNCRTLVVFFPPHLPFLNILTLFSFQWASFFFYKVRSLPLSLYLHLRLF